MGTAHQFTVGRMLKKIQKLKRQGKINNKSKIVAGDNGAIMVGKVDAVYEFGKELNIDFRETSGEILE